MKSFLVTGAAGFVGFHLASELSRDKNHAVFLSDSFIRGSEDELFQRLCDSSNVTFIPGDLKDWDFVSKLPQVAYVFHFAAFNGTQNFYDLPFDVFDNSITSTINLIRHYGRVKPLKFIYAGTSESYADSISYGLGDIPTAENVPIFFKDLTNPRWSYAFAKTGGEVAIHSASTQFQLNHLILRLHNLYGPRMGYEHVIPDLIRKQSVNSGEILGFNQSRSFMYVEDAVRLIVDLSLNDEFQNQTYNLGSNQEIKIIDLAKEISNLTGFRGKFVDIGAPRGSVARRVPDTSKIDKALGVQNLTSLKVGLQKTFSHMKPELGLS